MSTAATPRSVPATGAGTAAAPPPAALVSVTGVAVIGATVLASSVAVYNAYVVNVGIPAIRDDFGATMTATQWTVTGYLLSIAGLLLLGGALADRFGRRRVLVAGLGVMLVTSILCAVAPSIDALIAARVGQGVGAALVAPTSLALLNETLQISDRARGIGVWAGGSTLATTVGPAAGGALVDQASWRWVFVLNVPLVVLALLALLAVPGRRDARRPLSPDVGGALLTVLGLGGLTYALTEGPAAGWSSGPILAGFAVGALALTVLVPFERRVRAPIVRLSLFASRQFDAINITTALVYGGLSASAYLVLLQCQLQLGYTATQAGAALIPSTLVVLGVSPLSGALVARVGPRRLMVAGIVLVAASQVVLAQVGPGASYVSAILPAAVLHGLGLGLLATPLTAAVLAAVDDSDLGEASAINDASARVGALIAVGTLPVLLGTRAGDDLVEALQGGYERAMLAIGLVFAAAAVVTWFFVSDRTADGPPLAAPAPHHGCALPTHGPEVRA